jgi:drug/metabolite transporter (DMT)-like permease
MTALSFSKKSTLLGIVYALIAALGFSGKAILVKFAYRDGGDALTVLAWRMLFSLPFFLWALIRFDTPNHHPLKTTDCLLILYLGFVGYYLSSLFDFLGLTLISASLERLILFLYPTLVVIASAILSKKRLTQFEVLALILSYGGLLCVYSVQDLKENSSLIKGSFLVFMSALTYSSYLIGAGQAIKRLGTLRFTTYVMSVATLCVILQYLLFHKMTLFQQSLSFYGISFVMAIVSTVLPVFCLSFAIPLMGAGPVALIGCVGPFFTLFLAHYSLSEPISLNQFIGALMVLAGVLVISFTQKRETL